MKALISGGAGYIGSTIASALEDDNIQPVILDSLVTGKREFVRDRIFYHGDIADTVLLNRIFQEHDDIYCCIHCAALIVIPESVREDSPLTANCPYARTKIMMEQILEDFCSAYPLRGVSLRYFNPIGADPEMRSGPYIEKPTHLLGNLVETYTGRREVFELNGVDWPTRDGSALRDFVHVWDLARAHVLAVRRFDTLFESRAVPDSLEGRNDGDQKGQGGYAVINLGSEQGVTVREFVMAFESVVGSEIPKRETPPRPGDAVGAYASSERAGELLGWKAEKDMMTGIRDALEWDNRRKRIIGY